MENNQSLLVEVAPPKKEGESGHLDYLDGWRGLAIFFVLLDHFFVRMNWIEFGKLGVDIFFCLSGLLMSNLLFVRRVPLGRFYKRRISRVFPVFVLFVFVTYAIAMASKVSFSWGEVASTLFFFRTYFPMHPGIWSAAVPVGHLWSLNIEEHSYVLLSLVALIAVLRNREGWTLIGLGILSIILFVVYVEFPKHPFDDADIRTETVASHILISAGYFLLKKPVIPHVRPWMPIVSLLFGILSYTALFPWWSGMVLAPFFMGFAVNHLAETYKWTRNLLSSKWLRQLGLWSYSIYIWQQPFMASQARFAPGMALASAIVTGLVSYYFFENPVRDWLNENW